MSGSKTKTGANKTRQGQTRTYRVSPLVRAMRMTFAASLALTGSGMVLAGTCTAPASSSVECTGAFTDSIVYPNVPDLTLVLGPGGVPTSVIPAAGAIGVDVTSPGNIGISSFADITTDGASGIHTSGADSAAITNSGSINTTVSAAGARALDISAVGDVNVTNTGNAYADGAGVYDVTAIRAESTGTGYLVGVDNQASGKVKATSADGFAIGIYGYAASGDISINNDGAVSATSTGGLADGIFASGVNVDVTNGATGSITANGFNWAAGIEAQSTDLTTVSNSGDITATATANDETNGIYGQAFGIYATGQASGVNTSNSGSITADGVYATGVFTQAGGPITITNTGDITVGSNPALITYYGTGIHASNAYDNSAVVVNNSGNVSVYGYLGSTGIEAAATGAGSAVSVTNSGTIAMTGYAGTGILASGDGDTSIANSGSISSLKGDGAVALAFNGTASVTNSGDINAYVYGITASSQNGAGYVNNSGTVATTAAVQNFGIYASGATGATVINTGSVTAGVASPATLYSSEYSYGIFTHASLGDASVSNSGAVVTEGGKYGRGIVAIASQGDVAVTNAASGSVAVNQGKYAYQQVHAGVAAHGYGIEGISEQGDVSIDNAGSVIVASTRSFGLVGQSEAGNVSVSNSGTVDVYGFVQQIGMQAYATGGNVTMDNSGTITASATGNYAFPENNKAFGIVAYASGGDVKVSNEGTITAATGTGGIIDSATGYVIPAGNAIGISAASPDGNISVSNTGTITATSSSGEATALDRYGYVAVAGNAIGIYANGGTGDTTVSSDGAITATSTYGLADGIFAAGNNVDVIAGTASKITANGFNWAAGIEAQSYDLTTVSNSGDIHATATANDETNAIYGHAYGIFASGGASGVNATTSGHITADGVFATGVLAQGGGPVTVSNSGDITIGADASLITTYYATGIQATNNYENSSIAVDNSGSIAVNGEFGAKGIAAAATGIGSTVSVTNAGAISVSSSGSDYSNGSAILASGDAGASVHNAASGTVFASGNGYAYGMQALTFNGDANVVNDGSVVASADGNAKYSAYALGVLASSTNGNAMVSNTGSISANAASQASAVSRGIYATGVAADVVNSGAITTYGGSSLGIGAVGTTGDVTVLNQGSIHATGNKYSSGTGIAGVSTYGDVSLTNSSDGDIVALGDFGANGMQARSFYGDVNVVNAGTIEVGSSDPSGSSQPNVIGIYAGSRTGSVSVVNSGTILAQTESNPFGIEAFTTGDGTTTVDNSGTIQAISKNVGVWGIYTGGKGGGDISVHNSGTIEASTGAFHATGIWGYAGIYDYYGNGTLTGDISVVNDGTISVASRGDDSYFTYGLSGSRASGIWAYGMDTDVANTGSITADGFAGAGGIEAYSAGQTLVSNSGDISVSATANDATRRIYGQAFGIKATGGAGGVSVTNSGAITATAPFTAIGIYAAAVDGDSSVSNDGVVTATSTYGLADGIFATGVNVGVTTGTASNITASGFNWATGIEAQSYDLTTVNNAGDITATATANDEVNGVYGQAFGIYASGGAAGVNVTNSGAITADGVFATGVFIQSGGPITISNTGDITVGTNNPDPSTFGYSSYYATGIHAANNYDNSAVVVDNSGNLTVYGYLGSTGIEAGATGAGSTVSVTNSGNIAMTGSYGTGILASGDGDTSIANSGSISSLKGDGAVALAFNGTASVTNSGDISAYVYGITASSQNGAGYVNNSGTVETTAAIQNFGIYASGGTGATVINTGSVTAGVVSAATQYSSEYSYGIFTHASLGDASVSNSGAVVTEGGKYGRGIVAIASQGDVAVTNAAGGSIAVNQGKYAAQQADTGLSAHGYGIEGISEQGDVSIDNAGSVTVASTRSFGLVGQSEAGNVSVSNSGTVDVYGFVQQIGMQAYATGGNVTMDNSGTITASATGNYAFPSNNKAFGIVAHASGGDVNVSNEGTITAATGTGGIIDPATGYAIPAGDAFGISAASPDGNINVSNTGTITATSNSGEATALDRYGNVAVAGNAFGIYAAGTAGDTSVSNDGSISATSTFGLADGILASGQAVGITNAGDITATSGMNANAYGINASGLDSATVANSGTITANAGSGYAFGVYAKSNGDVAISNSGSVDATASGMYATGIYGGSQSGNVSISSSGAISAYSPDSEAVGMAGASYYGNVVVSNAGKIDAMSRDNNAIGMIGNDLAGNVAVSTSASSAITATAKSGDATGIFGNSFNGNVDVNNRGHVTANGHNATGIMANALYAGAATITNSGTIAATSTAGGDAVGVNAKATGPVQVNNSGTITASQPKHAVAVSMVSPAGSTLTNSGTITTVSALEGNIAVQGSASDDAIQNFGDIHGALVLGAGNDSLLNGNRGVWDVRNHATDFGAGDDVIENAAGGTIALANAAIHLGSSTGVGNAFTNDGTIKATGHSLIDMGTGQSATPLAAAFHPTAVPSLNALPLTNNGVIDFRDGQPNDILTVDGDLAGSGQLDLDVSLLKHTSDLLYVNGNVVDGASQRVNVSLDGGLPTTAHTPITFATVKGDSSSDSFVKGHVTDLSPRNFLDLQVQVSRNAAADAFSVDLDVAGLNDFGTLAASIGSGATSLINSQIGTWRQRMGVVPMPDGDSITVAPWVRAFSDSGDVDPRHSAANFGQSGNFGYHQSNSGQELGLNVGLQDGFSVGALLSQSEGHQRLDGMGNGSDRIKANTVGLYGTWMSPTGFYADTSLRRTDFKANLRSIGGEHRASGVGDALNVELGYTAWTSSGGVNLIPQFQYTLTSIHDIDMLHGDRFNFALQDSLSWRARLGLAVSKTINAGGFVWTPYGSVNAIQEMDGQSRYQVADQFTGTTSTKGTSGMVELGLGMQRGKFSLTGGANWTDGGAQQNVLGGQVVLRYTF